MSYSKKCETVEIEASTPLSEEKARLLDDVAVSFDDLLRLRPGFIGKMREGATKMQEVNAACAIWVIASMAVLGLDVALFLAMFYCSLPLPVEPVSNWTLLLVSLLLAVPFVLMLAVADKAREMATELKAVKRKLAGEVTQFQGRQASLLQKVLEALDSFGEGVSFTEVDFTLRISLDIIVPGRIYSKTVKFRDNLRLLVRSMSQDLSFSAEETEETDEAEFADDDYVSERTKWTVGFGVTAGLSCLCSGTELIERGPYLLAETKTTLTAIIKLSLFVYVIVMGWLSYVLGVAFTKRHPLATKLTNLADLVANSLVDVLRERDFLEEQP